MTSLQTAIDMLGNLFGYLLAHTEFGALAVGTLAAISITQVIKMLVIQYAPTNGGKGLWYSVTSAIGLIVTFANWPTVLGLSWGLVVGGFLAPALYLIGTRTLYRFYPDAEQLLSATPKSN